jgi:hypothetical protein
VSVDGAAVRRRTMCGPAQIMALIPLRFLSSAALRPSRRKPPDGDLENLE